MGRTEVPFQPNPYWNIVSGVEYYHDQVGSDAEQRDMINNTVSSLPASILDGVTFIQSGIILLHSLDILKLRLSFGGLVNALAIQRDQSNMERLICSLQLWLKCGSNVFYSSQCAIDLFF
ncbi:MAG: hypothetical protein R3B93_24310 [Bacteroidia bacterium]